MSLGGRGSKDASRIGQPQTNLDEKNDLFCEQRLPHRTHPLPPLSISSHKYGFWGLYPPHHTHTNCTHKRGGDTIIDHTGTHHHRPMKLMHRSPEPAKPQKGKTTHLLFFATTPIPHILPFASADLIHFLSLVFVVNDGLRRDTVKPRLSRRNNATWPSFNPCTVRMAPALSLYSL